MESLKMGGHTPEKERISQRDALVQSGIAQRMFDTINGTRGYLDPEITFGVEDCDFRVEKTVIPDRESVGGEEEAHIEVVIEMPNPHPENRKIQPTVQQAFTVRKGGSFGTANEPPLTQEQLDVIGNILREQ